MRPSLSAAHPHMRSLHDPWMDASVKSTPKTILGAALLAWYRADLGITLNGSNVSAWADQSGTGDANKNLTQATGALQPAFNAANASYNNLPTVSFSGSQLIQSGTWSAAPAQPFTRFIVGHTTAAASNRYFCDTSSGLQTAIYNSSGTGVDLFAGSTLNGATDTLNTPSIVVVVNNGNSTTIAVRQNTPQTTGAGGTNAIVGVTIGNFFGGGAFTIVGPIAEHIVASGALSAASIAAVTAYLATRYGLAQGA